MLVVGFVGCFSGPKVIRPVNDRPFHQARIPHEGFLLVDTTSTNRTIVVRDPLESRSVVIEVYDDTLGLAWSSVVAKVSDTALVPLLVGERRDESIALISAVPLKNDTAEIEERIFERESGRLLSHRSIVKLSRDRTNSRTAYFVSTSPDRRSIALYALGRERMGDTADGLALHTILLGIDRAEPLTNTFTAGPSRAIEDEDLLHVAAPFSFHANGIHFDGWLRQKIGSEFDDRVFRSPYDEVNKKIVFDGTYLYAAGYRDSLFHITRFDPRRDEARTQPLTISAGRLLRKLPEPLDIGIVPVAGDSAIFFSYFKESSAHYLSQSVIDFMRPGATVAPLRDLSYVDIDMHTLSYPLFVKRKTTLLFLQSFFYTLEYGYRTSRAVKVNGSTHFFWSAPDAAGPLIKPFDDRLYGTPINLTSSTSVVDHDEIDLLVYTRDTIRLAQFDTFRNEIQGYRGLVKSFAPPSHRHFFRLSEGDLLCVVGAPPDATLLRVGTR